MRHATARNSAGFWTFLRNHSIVNEVCLLQVDMQGCMNYLRATQVPVMFLVPEMFDIDTCKKGDDSYNIMAACHKLWLWQFHQGNDMINKDGYHLTFWRQVTDAHDVFSIHEVVMPLGMFEGLMSPGRVWRHNLSAHATIRILWSTIVVMANLTTPLNKWKVREWLNEGDKLKRPRRFFIEQTLQGEEQVETYIQLVNLFRKFMLSQASSAACDVAS